MTPSTEKDNTVKAAKAARKAETEAAKKKEEQEWRQKTAKQRDSVTSAIQLLEQRASELVGLVQRHSEQSGHLQAYYQEIEKLTKGKTLVPATDLIVQRCNEIIEDAKAIVQHDLYLDRVKQFISAGDNPVYPDVLITARTVLESIARSKAKFQTEQKRISALLQEARTIGVATRLYLQNDGVPSREDVEAHIDKKDLSESWFSEDKNGTETFDFDRLDDCSIESYFSDALKKG
jgi:uncharacterized membrane protein YqiK